MPWLVMRKVCRPGIGAWPRIFMTCILRFANKKRRRLPPGQPHAQVLDEVLQVKPAILPFGGMDDRSK